MRKVLFVMALAAFAAHAQDIKFPASFDKLAAKAEEVVDVTVDPAMLQIAGKFLAAQEEKEPKAAKAKDVVSGLKGIYVKSLKFAKEGEYSRADVDEIRSQLSGPGWARLVTVRDKTDDVGVYLKKEGEKVVGMAVLAAEPKELTVVNIVGPIDLEHLAALGGQFGVPNLPNLPAGQKPPAKTEKK